MNRFGMKAGACLLLASALMGAPALAAGPDLKVKLEGNHRSNTTNAGWATLSDKTTVVPGDEILYSVLVSNDGDREARHASAVGPIPPGTTFILDTASRPHGVTVDYSLDGGKTFSAAPTLSVTGKDGKAQTLPAPAERYTTVRWVWDAPLAAGAKASVSYRVKVR
jgi:uncharacterized repeat protein (TIGR01451 family)